MNENVFNVKIIILNSAT